MELYTDARQLAQHLLETAIEQLVASAPRMNHMALRSVGDACTLLGFESLAQQCNSILRSTPAGRITQEAITNIELPKDTRMMSGLTALSELQAQFPPLTDESVSSGVRLAAGYDTCLEPATAGSYDEAFEACSTESARELVALAQAVLGDIDGALVSADTHVEPGGRAMSVRFICVTELFRKERWAEANTLFNELAPTGVNAFSASHLALGANRITPWSGYPFPDY